MENNPVIPSLLGTDDQEEAEPESGTSSLEERLNAFRNQWQQELKDLSQTKDAEEDSKCPEETYILEQAKRLFIKGTQLEQAGEYCDATDFYRKATQLVPDIEFRIDFTTNSPRERQESESSVGSIDNQDEIVENLIYHFEKTRIEEDDKASCLKGYEQRATHISALPVELLHYIFKWVVSSDLDMKSLENLSQVCRGFYLTCRDEEIWRLSCVRVWGQSTGKCKKYGGWRNMFIQRPHVQTQGCYISKVAYFRQRDLTFGEFYHTYQMVVYYRFIRFFPDGKMMMTTSTEEPSLVVSKLRNSSFRDGNLLKGFYRLTGDRVTGVLKRVKIKDKSIPYYRAKERQQQNDNQELTYHIELEVIDMGKRPFCKLQWLQYSVKTTNLISGDECFSNLLEKGKINYFPQMIYSRVKSYSEESERPLV